MRDYIHEVMHNLFTEVPNLAGLINIFCGERLTNCWINEDTAQQCPRCSKRTQAEVHAETLNTFMKGIRSASPTAEFMAWAYMMASSVESSPIAPMLDVMNKTDSEVIWMGNFEHGSQKNICDRTIDIHEYSLSCIGPSKHFEDLAKEAIRSEKPIYAKLQVGTSYELSSVPYVPTPGIVYEKFSAAHKLGVTGAMLTWIPGGFPSPMLHAAGEASFCPSKSLDEFLLHIAAIDWGQERAPAVTRAWTWFSKAWQLYPFANSTLYWGPITRSVTYQLHLEREPRLAKPYNWGCNRNREPQPFEDQVARWLGPYTLKQVTTSFRTLAETWQKGLDELTSPKVMPDENEHDLQRQLAVARAIRLQCLAAANVYEFYSKRNQLRDADLKEQPQLVQKLIDIAEHDLKIAQEMLPLLTIEPTLGYESETYSFGFSKPLIEEKILQVVDMLPTLRGWLTHGVNPKILQRTVEDAQWIRPDDLPDRWGD